jgi:O-antigen ligase
VNSSLQLNSFIQTMFAWRRDRPKPSLAVIGLFFYFASCGIPLDFPWDISLLILAVFSAFAAFSHRNTRHNTLLIFAVLVFLISTGASILFSEDISRSMKLSVSFLPALLIFFLITMHFNGTKDLRLLYFALSSSILCLSLLLIREILINSQTDPFLWIVNVGSPILVVKNDVTLLSVIAPLSLALIYRKPRGMHGIIAGLSVFLSVIVISLFQSRVAMLTMVASITCFFTLIRPKIGLISCISSVVLILLIDGITGFSLIGRFIQHWDGTGRIPLWLSAWEMFLDAPLLGQGPHTFGLFYNSYLQNLNLPSWLFVDSRIVPWAHNLYLEILAEQGMIGFAALGVLLLSGLSSAWQLRKASLSEARILGYGACAGLFGFSLAAAVELTFLRQWVVISMFVLLGIIARLSCYEKTERR